MRRNLLGIMLCLALMAAAVGSAQASPSFRGYSGLVVVPTADTLNMGEFSFGAMAEDVGDFDASDLFVNYGPADNLEIGFNSISLSGVDDRETIINTKYRFLTESETKPGIAFGLIDLTNEIEATGYMVASKSLARGVSIFDNDITNMRGHIGFGGGRLDGLFLGLSAFVGNRVMFSLEWDSKDTNLGFRFTPVRGLRLHAALFDVGGRDDFGLGISFTQAY